MIGDVDAGPAPSTVHQGAIYLHGGRPFEVAAFDRGPPRVRRPFDGNWYTQPKRETDTAIERVLESRDGARRAAALRHRRGDRAGAGLPAQAAARPRGDRPDRRSTCRETSFATQALWYELDDDDLGTLHAAEHSQIAVLPLLAMCDRWDIGGLSTNWHAQTGGPTIFIYDGHPGGIGIARRGFEAFERLVGDAYRLVSECPCESGCPSCVQSPKCGNLNEPLARPAAQVDGRDAKQPTPGARGAGRSASRPSRPASR